MITLSQLKPDFLPSLSLPMYPTIAAGVLSLLSYLFMVRRLRFRHYQRVHAKYQKRFEEGRLTPEEAQRVIMASSQYDMPTVMYYAISFALFKTYAIPTISRIVLATRELGSMENVYKRYVDTELLIYTWLTCPISGKWTAEDEEPVLTSSTATTEGTHVNAPPGVSVNGTTLKSNGAANGHAQRGIEDPRAMIALSRVNWLHSKYPITNDDYLYTLALFILEPERWSKLYGWREFSELELWSYYIFWCEIAKRMSIHSVPKSPEAFRAWTKEYEQRAMVPAKSNHEVANYTLALLIHNFPETFGIKAFPKRMAISLLEPSVRIAMMYPEQPAWIASLTTGMMKTFSLFQYYFLLPRSEPVAGIELDVRKVYKEAGCPFYNLGKGQSGNSADANSGNEAGANEIRMHPKWHVVAPVRSFDL